MKIRQLQTLLDTRPSVSGSTFLVSALYIISWVLAAAFLLLGIGLLAESLFHARLFLNWVARQLNLMLNEGQRWNIAMTLGIISLALGVIFSGVIFLSKMVLKRNHFIIETEDWLYANVSELHKKPTPAQKRK